MITMKSSFYLVLLISAKLAVAEKSENPTKIQKSEEMIPVLPSVDEDMKQNKLAELQTSYLTCRLSGYPAKLQLLFKAIDDTECADLVLNNYNGGNSRAPSRSEGWTRVIVLISEVLFIIGMFSLLTFYWT